MIYVILVIAFLVRLVSLGQSLWLDEAISALAVSQYSLPDLIGKYLVGDFSPPLFFVLQWGWVRAFGLSEIALRLPSVIYGVGIVYFVFLIAKLASKKTYTPVLAALLTTFSPLLIYYSQEARMYSLAAFTATASFYFFIKHIKTKSRKYYILFFLFFSAALYSHYFAWFLIPIFGFWGLVYVVPLVTLLPWIPMLFSQLLSGTSAASDIGVWASLSALTLKNVALVFVKFVTGRISTLGQGRIVTAFIGVATLAFWVLSFLGTKMLWKKSKSMKDAKMALVYWLVVPLLFGAIVSLKIQVFSYFRFLFVVPAFIILISLGLEAFKQKANLFAGFLLVVSVIFSMTYLLNQDNHREDWKAAVEFVHKSDVQLVYIRNSVKAPFDYYDRGKSRVFSNPNDLESLGSFWYFPYADAIFDPLGTVESVFVEKGFASNRGVNFRDIIIWEYIKS